MVTGLNWGRAPCLGRARACKRHDYGFSWQRRRTQRVNRPTAQRAKRRWAGNGMHADCPGLAAYDMNRNCTCGGQELHVCKELELLPASRVLLRAHVFF